MTLHIADTLDLPDDAITQTFSILAKRGSGKTYTGLVMAEEMLERQQRLVAIDPIGVWWGLRSSADGRQAGYPVVIFGGDHGDLPLQADAGELIADLVVDQDLAVVLDLSLLRKGDQRKFLTAFLEALYHRNRRPLHVFVDEADAFAPQRPVKGGERLLGAMEDMVRRGRARGLGVTLITQRPATVHKDVLTQTEVLVALQMTGPQDRKAIDEWIKQHGDEERRQQLLGDLASLPTGTAYFWSPGWLDIFEKVQVRTRRTFDSSATPEVGVDTSAPTGYADVDLGDLRERMASLVEQAEADDPAKLRKRITDLERHLRDAETRQPEPETIEVPAVDADTLDRARQVLDDAATLTADLETTWSAAVDQLETAIGHLDEAIGARTERIAEAIVALTAAMPERPGPVAPAPRRGGRRPTGRPAADGALDVAPAPDDADADVKLKAGARRMLKALASPPGIRLTEAQIATLAGLAKSGGTWSTYWGTLTRNGLITTDGDDVIITDAGIDALGDEIPPPPETVDDVLAMYRPHLKAGARRMLDALLEAHPGSLTRDELGDAVDIAPSGGTFSTYLGTLRRNRLAEVDGDEVAAGPALFPQVAT